MKLLLFPVRLAIKACKVTAFVLALILVVVLLTPKNTAEGEQVCEDCLAWQELYAAKETECENLRQALSTEYQLLRRLDLRFFGQDWLTLHTVDFWGDVGFSHYEAFPENTQETIWSSFLLDIIFTTVERSCTQ